MYPAGSNAVLLIMTDRAFPPTVTVDREAHHTGMNIQFPVN